MPHPVSHPPGRILYTRRSPRWIHLVGLIATVPLVTVMFGATFRPEWAEGIFDTSGEMSLGFKVVIGLFCAIGVFMCGVFLYRLLTNPPTFVLYENGFEYAPGGVSTGLIRWTDVTGLRDETVLSSTGAVGPTRYAVTAVLLRNPEEYVARFPSALQPLFAARMKMNSSPILIARNEFGEDRAKVLAMMEERMMNAGG